MVMVYVMSLTFGCQDPTAANYDPNATDSPSNGGDLCPPLNFDYVNTGSNMTLFVTDGSSLSELGNGTIGVYFSDGGNLVCGGTSSYTVHSYKLSYLEMIPQQMRRMVFSWRGYSMEI